MSNPPHGWLCSLPFAFCPFARWLRKWGSHCRCGKKVGWIFTTSIQDKVVLRCWYFPTERPCWWMRALSIHEIGGRISPEIFQQNPPTNDKRGSGLRAMFRKHWHTKLRPLLTTPSFLISTTTTWARLSMLRSNLVLDTRWQELQKWGSSFQFEKSLIGAGLIIRILLP